MSALDRELEAVTFDCWNTLIYELDPMHSFEVRVDGMCRLLGAAGVQTIPARAAVVLQESWQLHAETWARGEASGAREVAGWALQRFGVKDGARVEELRQILEDVDRDDGIVALEGARQTLVELRERGIRRGLICDTGLTPGRVVRRLLDRHGLLEELEVLVFSDEVGAPKPAPHLFHRALAAVGVAPGAAAHVGDLRRTDVAGARGVGMASVRIRDQHDDESELPEADLVADSHAHLRELLGLAAREPSRSRP